MRCLLLATFMLSACTTAVKTPPNEGIIATADNIQLFYRLEGTGSPIVVLHGGPGMDHGSIANDLESLTEKHQLIFYDQRGGGRSSLPKDTGLLTIERHVSDLETVRQHFGLERITILAHSFGPAIAGLYAIAHPDRVERMIFIGPIPPRKSTFFEDYGAALASRVSPEDLERMTKLGKTFSTSKNMVKTCRQYWALATPPRLAKSSVVEMVTSDLCTAPPDAIRYGMTVTNEVTFKSLGEWDWRSQLGAVTAPVLIIHGQQDAIPMALVEEWAKALPNAQLLKVPDAAHFPHAERPEIVFPAITRFLNEQQRE